MDLRIRIVAARDKGGATRQQIADRFGVSLAFVKKILFRRKHFGTIAPFHGKAGRKPVLSPQQQAAMRAHIARNPGATLSEIREALGVSCSLPTIFNTLRRMKLTYKKNASRRRTGPARNPGVEEGLA